MSERVTVYVALLNEGTPVWRPAMAQPIDGGYRLLGPDHDPKEEYWQFEIGECVRCEVQRRGGEDVLVAMGRLGAAGPSA